MGTLFSCLVVRASPLSALFLSRDRVKDEAGMPNTSIAYNKKEEGGGGGGGGDNFQDKDIVFYTNKKKKILYSVSHSYT